MRGPVLLFTILLLLAAPVTAMHSQLVDDTRSSLEGNALTAPASDEPWAREFVHELPYATAANDPDGDKLFEELEDAYQTEPATTQPVIVVFQHEIDAEDGVERVRQTLEDLEVEHRFEYVPGFAADLTLQESLQLANLDIVRQLELDSPGTLELDGATRSMGVDAVHAQLNITGNHDGRASTFTGNDSTIAVLDTGFDANHVDLDDGKIIHFLDAGEPEDEAYDSGYHGTHVASIAAGTGDGDPAYTGVAPGASIIGLKIVDPDGERSSESVAIEAYEWIINHTDEYGIDVSTISFGFGTATDGTTALEMTIDEVWDAGVVNFKSTGNGGPERRTITVPAAARGILATGAMLDPDGSSNPEATGTPADDALSDAYGFRLATFSSRGPTSDGRIKPDIAAPGVSVMAADAGTEDGYTSLSGTSMASPFAAGVAALVLDANPSLTPEQVRDVMTSTTQDWGLGGEDIDYGAGRIQAANAVAEALARAGNTTPIQTPPVPYHEAHAGTLAGDGLPVAAPGTATLSVAVNETGTPLALTAIVEGDLLEVLVEDPEGDIVKTYETSNPASRQHVIGLTPSTSGEHTVTLVGTPNAAWVLDASHSQAGAINVTPEPPADGLEATGTQANPTPVGLGALVAAIAGAVLVGAVRPRTPR